MIVDFSKLSENKKYKTMSHTIFPRPVAWISSENDGIINLAPYSYFAPISSEPPLVIVSVALKEDGSPKDTFINIEKTKKCTINLAHKELLTELIDSSEPLPIEVSEPEHFGIKMHRILEDFPPMVEGVKCALFCEFHQQIDIGSKYEPLILRIVSMYIDDNSLDDKGHILLDNIGRVGMDFLIDSTRIHL